MSTPLHVKREDLAQETPEHKPTTRNYCFRVESLWVEATSVVDALLAIKDAAKIADFDLGEVHFLEVK